MLRLKTPLGRLLTGQPGEAVSQLGRLVKEGKPPSVITVGDIVSREALEAGIPVSLRIVDRKTMREPVESEPGPSEITYRVRNPPGVITDESLETIKRAMGVKQALIIVEGEEDLLALPAVLEAPDQSFVVYGQPLQGIVVIVTTASVRTEVRAMMARMKKEEIL
jgi:uncharacterized protein (UPF0218 family)